MHDSRQWEQISTSSSNCISIIQKGNDRGGGTSNFACVDSSFVLRSLNSSSHSLEVSVEHMLYIVLALLEVGLFAFMNYKAHECRRILISRRSICWQFQMQVTEDLMEYESSHHFIRIL